MTKMLSDPQAARAMGEAARERAHERFDARRTAEVLETVALSVVGAAR